ncbi:MAG: transcriptional regulator [Chloroflexi bacterium HGW-Chloroflexi-3]|nr:MAG: transcriptional regulator [Chloroflexi bacterium HGW-Chloroflexi-3]
MNNKLDFSFATTEQIEKYLCNQMKNCRLGLNITQAHLAAEAGIDVRTIRRLELGEGVSLDTFIRVLKALKLQGNLNHLLPDFSVRPIDRVRFKGRERMRARPVKTKHKESTWIWGDDKNGKSRIN